VLRWFVLCVVCLCLCGWRRGGVGGRVGGVGGGGGGGGGLSFSIHPDRIWESTFVDRWPFPSISCPVQPINLSSWHSTLNTWSSRYRCRRKPNADLPNMSFANCAMSSVICISLPLHSFVSSFSQTVPFSFIYLVFIFLPPSYPFLFLSLQLSIFADVSPFQLTAPMQCNKRRFICVAFNKLMFKTCSLRSTSLNNL